MHRARCPPSCSHKVTILAVCHALGWANAARADWWPSFGCALVIDLTPRRHAGDGDDAFVVRMTLDGAPLVVDGLVTREASARAFVGAMRALCEEHEASLFGEDGRGG